MRVPPGEDLADFAEVLLAIDTLWGTRGFAAWKDGQRELYEDLADSDAVALAVRKVITQPWEGSAADLLRLLDDDHHALPPALPGQAWTPRKLSGRIDRAQAALAAIGWKVERPKNEHTKRKQIGLWPPS